MPTPVGGSRAKLLWTLPEFFHWHGLSFPSLSNIHPFPAIPSTKARKSPPTSLLAGCRRSTASSYCVIAFGGRPRWRRSDAVGNAGGSGRSFSLSVQSMPRISATC